MNTKLSKRTKRMMASMLATLTFLLVLSPAFSQNPWIYITVPASLVPGQVVQMPVIIDSRGGSNIGSWNLILKYDKSVLTYQSTTGEMTGYSGLFMTSDTYAGVPLLTPADQVFKATFACFNPPGYPYAHKTVFTINFLYNGGDPAFTWFNISAGTSMNNDTYVKSNPANIVNTLASFNINTTLPENKTLADITVQPGQPVCYNAIRHLIVAGNGTLFKVLSGGNVTLIAGEKISLMPGTTVNQGGYVHGYITETWNFCGGQNAPIVANNSENGLKTGVPESAVASAKIYPNPTSGIFALETVNFSAATPVQVTLFSILGEITTQMQIDHVGPVTLSLEGKPTGIYILRIKQGSTLEYLKVIKQ